MSTRRSRSPQVYGLSSFVFSFVFANVACVPAVLLLASIFAFGLLTSAAYAQTTGSDDTPPFAATPVEFVSPPVQASTAENGTQQETAENSAPKTPSTNTGNTSEEDADKTHTRMLLPIPASDSDSAAVVQDSQPDDSSPENNTVVGAAESVESSAEAGESIESIVDSVTKNMNDKQLYKLEYRLKEGETIRWNVEHTANTETRMAGHSEKTSMRCQSVKRWDVTNVDSLGGMTFTYSIDSTIDWLQIGENEPVTYDSTSDLDPPDDYKAMADKIGKPLGVISTNPTGQITNKNTRLHESSFGAGDTTVPLPDKLIATGHKWFVPRPMTATDESDRTLNLQARTHYELVRVKLPHAYIAFRTEVLTPVDSPQVESQIMQQMTRGYLVFDIQRGLPVKKEIEWNEQVQGFAGPDSYLEYVARMTETLITDDSAVTGQPARSSRRTGAVELKTRDADPLIRK